MACLGHTGGLGIELDVRDMKVYLDHGIRFQMLLVALNHFICLIILIIHQFKNIDDVFVTVT